MLCGECWKIGPNQNRFACFVDHVDVLLWAVGWKAFNKRRTGAEMCLRKETLVVMKGGLEGSIKCGEIVCWLDVSRYRESLNQTGKSTWLQERIGSLSRTLDDHGNESGMWEASCFLTW